MARCKTSPKKINELDRRLEALKLRIAGKTFREVGEALGVTEQRAHQLVTEELARLDVERSEARKEALRLELERLDALHAGVWEAAAEGDPEAIDRVIKIMQRRAALRGLDAPKRVKAEMTDGTESAEEMSDDELTGIARGRGRRTPPEA